MTGQRRRPRRRRPGDAGTTLVEALAALTLLGMTVVFILDGMSNLTRLNTRAELRSQATVAARAELERLRLIDPATMQNSGDEERDITIDRVTFRVVTNYCSDSDSCDDVTRHLHVEVFRGSDRIFDVETVYTRLR